MTRRPQVDHAHAIAYHLRALAPGLLDGMVCEYRFHDTRRWRFDAAWPRHMVAIEIDGGQFAPGAGRHAQTSDYEKRNAATAAGWRVLFYRPQQLDSNPQIMIDQLRETIRLNESTGV